MMTQAFLNPTVVGQMKLPFNNLFCGAEVDTLMQMSEAVDMEGMEDMKSVESENPKDIFARPVESLLKGKPVVKDRKPRTVRNMPGRPYHLMSRRQKEHARKLRRIAPAPDNTTQFLMSDRACLDNYSDSDMENDSESEDDFVKREFCKEYEKATPIKQKMPKSKLIEEYMMVEKDVKLLEKKYDEMSAQEQLKARLGTVDYEWEKGEVSMEPEIAEKIRIFQQEILKLAQENRSMALENTRLVEENSADKSDSSSSSDSDSSDSDSDSSSSDSDTDSDSSSSEDEVENEEAATSTGYMKDSDLESKKDDTGYESDRSAGSNESKSLVRVTSSTLRKQ
eukprot:GFUD01018928.1.p1 GENE.GFUD01018928.1~~GFUD01018928.1.p1  ORF type:complete len:338 (+),score=96.42 GFUD01018928.1:441-1454(+)